MLYLQHLSCDRRSSASCCWTEEAAGVRAGEEQEDLVTWPIQGQVAGVREGEEQEDRVAWLIQGQVAAQLAVAGRHHPAAGGSGLTPQTGY